MHRRSSWLLKSTLWAIMLMACVAAYGQAGKITGRLMLDQGAVSDEMIVLKNAEGRICNGTMTDERGEFSFTDIAPGTYTLVGKYKDFEAEAECIVVAGEVAPVMLHCKKKSLFQWIPDKGPHRAPTPVFTDGGQFSQNPPRPFV